MGVRLAVVAQDGTLCFEHEDIQQCRNWLYDNGLECSHRGWTKEGWYGWISFDKGKWFAGIHQV